jgi:CPA1 family monovalent cation:H+ antiporter
LISRRKGSALAPWRHDLFIGFTGIRGVVSLAAALSIPLAVHTQPFPQRGVVLIITFAVILVTLVGQGLLLPWVVRALKLTDEGRREVALAKGREIDARVTGIDAALDKLSELEAAGTSSATTTNLRSRQHDRREYFVKAKEKDGSAPTDFLKAQLEVINAERRRIAELYAQEALTDEARRRIERELDLEDARARHAYRSGLPIEVDGLP